MKFGKIVVIAMIMLLVFSGIRRGPKKDRQASAQRAQLIQTTPEVQQPPTAASRGKVGEARDNSASEGCRGQSGSQAQELEEGFSYTVQENAAVRRLKEELVQIMGISEPITEAHLSSEGRTVQDVMGELQLECVQAQLTQCGTSIVYRGILNCQPRTPD